MPVHSTSGMYLLLSLFVLSGVTAHNILFLGLNEVCKNGTEPWTCKAATTCKGLKNGLEKYGGVKLCSFVGSQPIICCPPEPQGTLDEDLSLSSRPQGGKKAEQKCREYAKYVFNQAVSLLSSANLTIDTCGMENQPPLIVAMGGTDAKINELPHMALIGVKREGNVMLWFCGGSLISLKFVLTAAHCFLRFNDQLFVRVGELEIEDSKDDATSIDIKVSQIINHPLFTPTKVYHDISLLKLEKEVVLGPSIRPLCLHTDVNIDRPSAIASGWGFTSVGYNRVTSNILQKVPLDLVDGDKCVSAYGVHWPKLSKGIKPDIMMCSGGTRGKDTCQGDSGGPLQIVLKEPYCMYSQIGITSFGIGCGSITPGVYTRVSAYVQWIENIVWP